MKKEMSFAGSFYSQDRADILEMFKHFDKLYEKHFTPIDAKPKIILVPHAGHIYSGFTASVAYKTLQNTNPKTAIILAPSHRVLFDGFSTSNYSSFKTPLGDITSDDELIKDKPHHPKAHIEHSSEVQLPFIKHYLPNTKVVEIIYSDTTTDELLALIEKPLSLKDVVLIVSTDLSHFHTQKEANSIDSFCIKALLELNSSLIQNPCEACGAKGFKTAIEYAKKHSLTPKLLDYRTSADVSGDTSSVVGYMSGYFT
ncbi:MAG: AmmeMemoRadiSam system protein B [Sulfurimonas sp.]